MDKYPEMKKSGVSWADTIPSSWSVRRGKTILALLSRPIKDDDEIITCFRDGEVTLRKNRREEGFTVALQENGYQGIEPGDLVVHGMDGFAGAIGISDSRGKATPVLNVMDSTQKKKFLMYYLRALAYKDVFMSLSTGIRVRSCDLRWNKLAVLPFIVPSLPEQAAIVSFLDDQLTQIDSIITETQASIEEYKQWKAALIFDAVTKGLDPSAKYTESGLEWVGSIPINWKVYSLTKVFSSIVDYRGKTPEKVDEGIFLVTAKNIKNGYIDYTASQEYVKPEEYEEIMHRGKPQIGDVLFTTEAPLGQVANVDRTDIALAQRVIKFRTDEKTMDNYYLKYWILSDGFQKHLSTYATGSTAKGIKASKLGLLRIIIPPIEEQRNIVKYLDVKCRTIDELVKEKTSLISDLDDYKRSLIYDVVTGKRKVV